MDETKSHDDYFWEYYGNYNNIDFPERDTAGYIETYTPPVLLVLGTFGNIVSAIILRRMYQRVLSTCLYCFVVVIVDLLVLYVLAGNVWVARLTDVNLKHTAMLSSNSLCKIYPFIADLLIHLSIWLTVAMVIETTVVVIKPAKLLRTCSLERSRAVILLIVVLLICVNAHCFWTFALVKVDKTTIKEEVCTTARQGNHNSEEFRKIVWPIMDIVVADLLPYCVLFSCTVMLLTKRCRRRRQQRRQRRADPTDAADRELEAVWKSFSLDATSARQFQTSFLALALMHLVLLLSKLGNDIFHFLVDAEGLSLVEYTLVLESKMLLSDAVCSTLLFVFVSCKFFVLLATCRRFREEFVAVMTCRSCKRRRRGAGTATSAAVSRGRTIDCKGSVSHHQPLLHSQQPNNIDHASLQPIDSVTPNDNCTNLSPRKQIYSMTSV